MGYFTGSDYVDMKYLSVDRLRNSNLQWEKTSSWNFGLDFGFLNNRIGGSLEAYFMKTTDMIMNQRLPGFCGFGSVTTNLGEVQNNGFELSLNTKIFWMQKEILSDAKNRMIPVTNGLSESQSVKFGIIK